VRAVERAAVPTDRLTDRPNESLLKIQTRRWQLIDEFHLRQETFTDRTCGPAQISFPYSEDKCHGDIALS
jgi:hypothetical protein